MSARSRTASRQGLRDPPPRSWETPGRRFCRRCHSRRTSELGTLTCQMRQLKRTFNGWVLDMLYAERLYGVPPVSKLGFRRHRNGPVFAWTTVPPHQHHLHHALFEAGAQHPAARHSEPGRGMTSRRRRRAPAKIAANASTPCCLYGKWNMWHLCVSLLCHVISSPDF